MTVHASDAPSDPPTPPAPGSAGLQDPHFHGRRHGRRLRPGQQRLLETRLPALRLDPARLDAIAAGRVGDLFATPVERVYLEIGFGGGEHILAVLEDDPAAGVIGSEPFLNGNAKLISRIEESPHRDDRLARLRLWDDDAKMLLPALPGGGLTGLYVLYPDPWPKRRHRKRRFIGPESVPELVRLLRPGGWLLTASDDAGLIDWMLWHLRRAPELCWDIDRPGAWETPPPGWQPTRYEEKARAAGRRPAYLRFTRL